MLRSALQTVDRREIADRAAAVLEHVPRDALHQEVLGAHVHVVQHVELLRRDLQEGLVERDPGVVDQAVDAAQELDRARGQTLDLAPPRRSRPGTLRPGGRVARISATAEAAPSPLWA